MNVMKEIALFVPVKLMSIVSTLNLLQAQPK
jgi:hypothetical protein